MIFNESLVNKMLNDIISGKETFTASSIYTKAKKTDIRINETFSEKYNEYLNIARPRQNKSQKKYRKEFFEQEGNPVSVFIDRVCNKFSVIFQNKDYGIFYENKETKEAIEDTGFEKWFVSNIFRILTLHPNGCIYLTNEADGLTEKVSFGFAEPKDVLICSDSLCIIKNFDDYYFYTKDRNFKAVKVRGDKDDVKISNYDIISYENLTGNINAYKIGLHPKESTKDGQILYTGVVDNAITHLRMAQFHWLDYATNSAYGVNNLMWMAGNKTCGKCKGKGTYLNGNASSTCDVCDGKGTDVEMYNGGSDEMLIIPMQISGELAGSDNNRSVNIPSNIGGYIKGDPEPAKVYSQFYIDELERAFFAISMETILRESNLGSARQKEIEREELNQMLKVISGLVCDWLEDILGDICTQMFGYSQEIFCPNVIKPSEFNFLTEQELLKTISEISNSDVSELYISNLKLKLVEKQSGLNSIDLKRQTLINIADPVAGKSQLAKAQSLPTLEWWQNVLSNQLLHLIYKAELENELFWTDSFNLRSRLLILESMAKQIAEQTKDNVNREYPIKNQVNTVNLT